jgi:hypothetical protein
MKDSPRKAKQRSHAEGVKIERVVHWENSRPSLRP